MNQDRKTEILEQAAEMAIFYLELVKCGVPPADASSLAGSWFMQQRFIDQDGDDWKNGDK